jgi:hypothetical protein
MVWLCNLPARDMTERGWSISKRVLSVPSHSCPPVRWACHQEMSSAPPALSLHYCSRISWTRTNPSKTLVYLQKKVSTPMYLKNKFMDGVKFIPLDGVVIWVWRHLLKIFRQTQQPDTECWKLNVLVLFSYVICLKRPRVIDDVIITVWISIQPK